MKYFAALLMLAFPLTLLGQDRANTLLPEADVLFRNEKIIYLISHDTYLPIIPLTWPQAYQMEYLHTGMPHSVYFGDQQSLLQYLGQISLADASHDDLLLFLRAAALYKIWVGIGYVSETVDLKPELHQLSENASSEISNMASKVMEIK